MFGCRYISLGKCVLMCNFGLVEVRSGKRGVDQGWGGVGRCLDSKE